MKHVLLLLFLASPALAQVKNASWSESQALTRAAPTTSSTDGIALKNVTSWRLVVCAASGQALTGGDVTIWVQTQDGLWADTPRLTALLVVTSTSQRCQSLGEFPVGVNWGRLLPASHGITVSGGTTVTMKLEVQLK